jgi:abscisic-aldehyde oxidase
MDEKNSSEIQTSLIFCVNGDKFELSNVDPSTTLLEFLRTQTRFKSVKLGCGEGIKNIIYLMNFLPDLDF